MDEGKLRKKCREKVENKKKALCERFGYKTTSAKECFMQNL